ncbi:hypothetical protein ES705_23729 [subsurface metagenome]
MPQKALTVEKIEELQSLRSQGLSLREIAAREGVSQGAVSNYTRDIAKPAKRTQRRKEAPKSRHEGKDTIAEVVAGPYEAETRELANQLKRAEIQEKLDLIVDRKDRGQELADMRLRERRILLELDTVRQGAAKGDSSVVGELSQLRGELGELREARHQAEIRQIEDKHAGEMRQFMASIQRTGLTEYDLMSQAMTKTENLVLAAAGKIDGIVKSSRQDKQLMLGLQLGLTPPEYSLLLQGEDEIPTREDWEMGRRYRAHREGVKLEEPEPGEFEGLVSLIQQRNKRFRVVMDKISLRLGQGGASVVKTGKPGKAPEPGEPEPPVLKAESKLVTCSRCATTFDIDLVEAKQQAAAGKKLFINCANPKCNFLLDISEMIPELTKPERPECYQVSPYGCGNKGNYDKCRDCKWIDIAQVVYE